jgi:hypothetical protein
MRVTAEGVCCNYDLAPGRWRSNLLIFNRSTRKVRLEASGFSTKAAISAQLQRFGNNVFAAPHNPAQLSR